MSNRSDALTKAPVLKLPGAFIRRTDLSGANLRGANLSKADATGALFRGANFDGTVLIGTVLRGADLTGALNLTEEQLAAAVIDDTTRLPTYIDFPTVMRLKAGDIQF